MLYILLALSLFFLTFGKAIADIVSEEDIWRKSWFSKFDINSYLGCKDYTWKRKYTNNKITTWLLSNPLVFLTDIWHLANTIQRLGLYLAIVCAIYLHQSTNINLLNVSIFISIFIGINTIGFHIFYHYVFLKK